MKKLLLILLLSPLLSFGQMFGTLGYYYVSAGTPTPSSNEWNVEVNNSLCGTANTDTFTIVVKLQSDTLKHTSQGGLVASMLGNDIRFYETDTNTLMNWAKERYDPDSGIVIMHVKKNLITYATAATFKMDCGRTTDTNTFHGGATGTAWKSTVIGAYFMNDATGANLTDNSAYGNDATQVNSPVRTVGQIGYAEQMTAASTQYYATSMPEIDGATKLSILFLGQSATSASHVVHGKRSGSSGAAVYAYNDGFLDSQLNGGYGGISSSGTAWKNLVMVFDGGGATSADKCKIYLNGANQILGFGGTIPTSIAAASGDFNIGKDGTFSVYQGGITDNLIIIKDAVSSSHVTTFYNNLNDPGNLGSAGFLRFYH